METITHETASMALLHAQLERNLVPVIIKTYNGETLVNERYVTFKPDAGDDLSDLRESYPYDLGSNETIEIIEL